MTISFASNRWHSVESQLLHRPDEVGPLIAVRMAAFQLMLALNMLATLVAVECCFFVERLGASLP